MLLALASPLAAQQTVTLRDTLTGDSVAVRLEALTWWHPPRPDTTITPPTDTTVIPPPDSTPLPPVARGIPFGPYSLPAGPTLFTGGFEDVSPSSILQEIAAWRAQKRHLIVSMTGGAHNNYKTNGKYDVAKFQARMDLYNTPTIKAAVAKAVADGIIIGNSVMDEPQQEDAPGNEAKSWGPHGWMTKATIDDACKRVKGVFPTLAVGVVNDHRVFYPETNYAVCDVILSQYRASKGPVAAFVAGGKAFAARSRMNILFMLNVVHGGAKVGTGCAPGMASSDPGLCNVSAAEIKAFGFPLLTGSTCAFVMWKYDGVIMGRAENKPAFQAVADSAAKLPARSCKRTG